MGCPCLPYQTAVSTLAKEGIRANLEQLDIADEKSRNNFVDVLQRKYKHVDCLVNNAGKQKLPFRYVYAPAKCHVQ